MIVKGALTCSAAVLPLLVAPASLAAAPSPSVEILNRPAVLLADGTVNVTLSIRCESTLQAFELDTSVSQTQSGAFGSDTIIGPPVVVPCDGSKHRVVVNVAPYTGAFTAGTASVSVYAGFYDSATGRDTEATDTETVRLKRA